MVKALDLSSNGRMSAWVRTPLLVGELFLVFPALIYLLVNISKAVIVAFYVIFFINNIGNSDKITVDLFI